jgi:hypothetical protein
VHVLLLEVGLCGREAAMLAPTILLGSVICHGTRSRVRLDRGPSEDPCSV